MTGLVGGAILAFRLHILSNPRDFFWRTACNNNAVILALDPSGKSFAAFQTVRGPLNVDSSTSITQALYVRGDVDFIAYTWAGRDSTHATDIFPNIDIPVVSVIWNYTGLSPEEMSNRIILTTKDHSPPR